jgi:hypothetical protein
MLLNLLALGFKGYLRDYINILDGIIVLISILDTFISYGGSKAA